VCPSLDGKSVFFLFILLFVFSISYFHLCAYFSYVYIVLCIKWMCHNSLKITSHVKHRKIWHIPELLPPTLIHPWKTTILLTFYSVEVIASVTSHTSRPERGYTAKNPENFFVLFSKMRIISLKMRILFLKSVNNSPIWEKNAHFEEKVLIFEKRTDFFLTIFPSVELTEFTLICHHIWYIIKLLQASNTIYL